MRSSRAVVAAAAVSALFGLGLGSAHAAQPPYSIVTGTGAAGNDQGTFPGTSGSIPELNLDWAVTADPADPATPGAVPATTSYHVYAGVQRWKFTRNGAPATVNLAFAISGIDAWLDSNGTQREAIGLPVGTQCDISNPAYVFPAGATDGTPGNPIFSFTPDNGSGLAVLQYLGGPGLPVNRYNQYAAVPCTYTGSQLVLTGKGFPANVAGGTSFWHGLAYLRVLNSPAPTAVPTTGTLGLLSLAAVLGVVGSFMARRRRLG